MLGCKLAQLKTVVLTCLKNGEVSREGLPAIPRRIWRG
jgi:hypothetical protein